MPILVTCRHVVAGAERGRVHLILADTAAPVTRVESHTLILDDFQARWLPHPETAVDLCVMPMAEHLVAVQQRTNRSLQLLPSGLIPTLAELAELTVMEDVVVVGYPNGIWDSVHYRPIVRKGITATEPNVDYLGRAEFLVDRAWLPGTSGSPVFLWNMGSYVTRAGELQRGSRVKLLGILSSSPGRHSPSDLERLTGLAAQRDHAGPGVPDDLGTVVKVRKLLEFEPILEAVAVRGQRRWAW